MTDQLVRSEVFFEYTLIDMELDRVLFRYFFSVSMPCTARGRDARPGRAPPDAPGARGGYVASFGSGKRLTKARASRRYRTLRQLLLNLYPLQKLAIARTFRNVPKAIVSKVAAINELRNGVAHTFFLDDLSLSRRSYKGVSILKSRATSLF